MRQGLTKKEKQIEEKMKKNHMEIPWVLVFKPGIPKLCHTILQNFQG